METKNQTLRSVWYLLCLTYGILAIAAGADKFINLLVQWQIYLHPAISSLVPASAFMKVAGVVEILAGILVLAKPSVGGYVVMTWLMLISLNLFAAGFYDIAVRDLVMSVGAYALSRLSALEEYEPSGILYRDKIPASIS